MHTGVAKAEGRVAYLTAGALYCALGHGVEVCASALLSGQVSMGQSEFTLQSGRRTPVGRISEEAFSMLPAAAHGGASRLDQLLLGVCLETLGQLPSQLLPARTQLIYASSKGNIACLTTGAVDYGQTGLVEQAQRINEALGLRREPLVVSQACVSSLAAVALAQRLVRGGEVDNVLVCTGDELTPFVVEGFAALRALSYAPARPFDSARSGLNLGESAAAVLVTSDAALVREEQPMEICGGGFSDDAYHLSAPSADGVPLHEAIEEALREAGMVGAEVGLVSPHGTATRYNDEMESQALALSGLSQTPAVALKGALGHTLGASGLSELLLDSEFLRRQQVCGTPGFSACGTGHPVAVSRAPRPLRDARYLLKTASGFGGCNVALVCGLATHGAHRAADVVGDQPFRCSLMREVELESGRLLVDGRVVLDGGERGFGQFIREAYGRYEEVDNKFARLDGQSQLAAVGMRYLLDGVARAAMRHSPVLFANHNGCMARDQEHLAQLARAGQGSPSIFLYTLPSTALGEVCIRHGLQGETLFLMAAEEPSVARFCQLMQLLRPRDASLAIAGWCDYTLQGYRAHMMLFNIREGSR